MNLTKHGIHHNIFQLLDVANGIRQQVMSNGADYSHWKIGLTSDLERARAQHGNPPAFSAWQLPALYAGEAVARHYAKLGMQTIPPESTPDSGAGIFLFIFQVTGGDGN